MTKIFVSVPESIIERNIIHTGFWPRFLELAKGHDIFVLVSDDKVSYYTELFRNDSVSVVGFKRQSIRKKEHYLMSIVRNAVKNNSNLLSKMKSYERGDSGLFATYFKRAFTFIFGDSILVKKLLRKKILSLPNDTNAQKLFEDYKLDVFVSLSLTNFDFDVVLAREARKRKIPIIGMVRSWDNLSSHGLLRVVPDVFLLQNKFLELMAYEHQAIRRGELPIEVIGLPHYDFYKNIESLLWTKEEFFKRASLDINKKFILYGAMGDFLFPYEGGVADVFEAIITAGKINGDVQVLYRAHPKFTSPFERMKGMKFVKPDLGSKDSEGKNQIEMNKAHTQYLINSIYHADVVVTGGSTFAVDAVMVGKRVICIGFDGIEKNPKYWHGAMRFFDCYTHFQAFMSTGVANLAKNPDELATLINDILKNPEVDKNKREAMIDLLVAPYDGKAGERLAGRVSFWINKLSKK